MQQLPARIDALEQRQQALEEQIADPQFYQGDREQTDKVLAELTAVQTELESVFERWSALEDGKD